MHKHVLTFALAAAMLLCSACGGGNPDVPETPEISAEPEIIPEVSAGVEPEIEPDPDQEDPENQEPVSEIPAETEPIPNPVQEEAPEIPAGEETLPDLSGTYTDRLGTEDIYSSLELTRTRSSVYSFSLSLYRTALLEGTAAEQDGVLHFTSEEPHVEGDITIRGQAASVKITQSDFPDIVEKDVYSLPDGPAA